MSLKAFHIFFIAVSALTAFGFGGWGLWAFATGLEGIGYLALGLASVAAGVGLIVYGRLFLKKFRHVSSL